MRPIYLLPFILVYACLVLPHAFTPVQDQGVVPILGSDATTAVDLLVPQSGSDVSYPGYQKRSNMGNFDTKMPNGDPTYFFNPTPRYDIGDPDKQKSYDDQFHLKTPRKHDLLADMQNYPFLWLTFPPKMAYGQKY